MKTITIFIIAVFLSINALAQTESKTSHTIKGKVIDASTNQPVSYTNIGLEDTYYGTASDGDGNFELKIPEAMASKNIYFSAVGYGNKKLAVKSLFNKEFHVIKLTSQSYGINEVDVAAQNLVLIRILRMASENIKYNYGAGPFNLHCDYTDKTLTGDSLKAVTAQVLIYDKSGYARPSATDEFQSRKYKVEKEKSDEDYRFSTGVVNIDDMLDFDWVRSASSVLNPALLTDFRLALDSEPVIDGKEYWVISFKQEMPTLEGSGDFYATGFEGNITINKEDYSVLKVEGKIKSPRNNRQGKGLAVGNSNNSFITRVSYQFTTEYKNLLINRISLNKSYLSEGKNVSEKTTMQVIRARSNNLTVIESRDYFQGE
ncbi:MAG: carboxypeptidase-like regulatory domain-containing protein [Bacteroidota bacterium]